ncbi:MAG: 16S rRNA (guanine(966)-N(2))-methyltransferase RsmD [Chloroflexi bacterium]|nr:16S rRNA (guanine(966)-N(2))-methyltransferase RsmD [Chloroflexota bacterium]
MRVISGSAKGRRLKMVPGEGTRPVGDKVKQALFNILGADIEGATFLDLFAGTGSVGIEALSRGAARAVFVESDRMAAKIIGDNLAYTGLADRAQVVRGDAFRFLGGARREAFDFVYIAPPQYADLWRLILSALDAHPDWLNPDGMAIAQINPVEYNELSLTALRFFDQRKYGSTLLCFYEKPGD